MKDQMKDQMKDRILVMLEEMDNTPPECVATKSLFDALRVAVEALDTLEHEYQVTHSTEIARKSLEEIYAMLGCKEIYAILGCKETK